MDLHALTGGLSLGADQSGRIKLTLTGQLAVQRDDGVFVAVAGQGQQLQDVTPLVLDGSERYIYRVPVPLAQVQVGDYLLISEAPFQVLVVNGAPANGKVNGTNLVLSSVIEWIPPTNVLGTSVVVRLTNIVQGMAPGGQGVGAQGIDPRMLMLLSDRAGGLSDLLVLQALAGGQGLAQLWNQPAAAPAAQPADAGEDAQPNDEN
jgi:hypothetical protein